MRSVSRLTLSFMFAVGLSGCSGSDTAPVIAPSAPPIAAAGDDQRVPQSDEMTSEEAALWSQGESEPDPAPRQDI